MKIEKALDSDLEKIYNIETQTEDSWSYDILKQDFLGDSPSEYYVIKEDGEILGFVSFMNVLGEVHINNIAVDTDKRRRGLGARLLKFVLNFYPKEDIMGVTLEVRTDNTPALKLYEKFGFSIVGKRDRYYKRNKDAFIMWKMLGEIE